MPCLRKSCCAVHAEGWKLQATSTSQCTVSETIRALLRYLYHFSDDDLCGWTRMPGIGLGPLSEAQVDTGCCDSQDSDWECKHLRTPDPCLTAPSQHNDGYGGDKPTVALIEPPL
jgi:hypothetical protein